MYDALIDIIDLCNTDPCIIYSDTTNEQWTELIDKINDIAHLGIYGNFDKGRKS